MVMFMYFRMQFSQQSTKLVALRESSNKTRDLGTAKQHEKIKVITSWWAIYRVMAEYQSTASFKIKVFFFVVQDVVFLVGTLGRRAQ